MIDAVVLQIECKIARLKVRNQTQLGNEFKCASTVAQRTHCPILFIQSQRSFYTNFNVAVRACSLSRLIYHMIQNWH